MTGALRKMGWIVLGLLALVQTGCMLAVAGAAGAAGAAGYMYLNGLLYRDYHAGLTDTVAAARTSLEELQFPLLREKTDANKVYLETKATNGEVIRLYLELFTSPIPAEGAITRVGVRVGFAGDDDISVRILDQISRHLVSPSRIAPIPQPTATGAPAMGTPKPVETAPPPLLPTTPTPVAPASRGDLRK